MRTFLLCTACLLFTKPAYAYIDPGTGALILQMLVAAVATAAITVKMWWNRLISFFKKTSKDDENDKNRGEDTL